MCLLTMVYSYSCISDGGRLCACSPWCALAHNIHTAAMYQCLVKLRHGPDNRAKSYEWPHVLNRLYYIIRCIKVSMSHESTEG